MEPKVIIIPRGPTKIYVDRGPKGAAGDAATITVGTVTTGAPGSEVGFSNVGTPWAAVFNITIPRGDPGADGADGAEGPQGPQGNPGTTTWSGITGKPTTISGFGITDAVTIDLLAAPSGVATLDAGGKLLSSQLPDIAIVEYLGAVASQAAMLALTGQKGDWTTRTDLGSTWIITGNDPSVIGGWTQLSYPTAPVISVSGKTGAVTLNKSDVGLPNADNTADSDKPVSTAQAAADTAIGTAAANALAAHAGAGGGNHPVATTSVAGFLSGSDKTKLDGIATAATANSSDAFLLSRANHTGTQSQSTIVNLTSDLASVASTAASALAAHAASGGTSHPSATTSVAGFLSSTDKTKLDGVATGATANATNAQLRDRSTHTGTQAQSTIVNLEFDISNLETDVAAAGSTANNATSLANDAQTTADEALLLAQGIENGDTPAGSAVNFEPGGGIEEQFGLRAYSQVITSDPISGHTLPGSGTYFIAQNPSHPTINIALPAAPSGPVIITISEDFGSGVPVDGNTQAGGTTAIYFVDAGGSWQNQDISEWSGNVIRTQYGGLGANNSSASGVPLFSGGVVTMTLTSGTGDLARVNSPAFVTPVLGAASATSLTVSGAVTAATITIDAVLSTASRIVGVTASRNLATSDNGKRLVVTGTATVVLTAPSGLTSGFCCEIINNTTGAGSVTIATSGTTLNGGSTSMSMARLSVAEIRWTASDAYIVTGIDRPRVRRHSIASDVAIAAGASAQPIACACLDWMQLGKSYRVRGYLKLLATMTGTATVAADGQIYTFCHTSDTSGNPVGHQIYSTGAVSGLPFYNPGSIGNTLNTPSYSFTNGQQITLIVDFVITPTGFDASASAPYWTVANGGSNGTGVSTLTVVKGSYLQVEET